MGLLRWTLAKSIVTCCYTNLSIEGLWKIGYQSSSLLVKNNPVNSRICDSATAWAQYLRSIINCRCSDSRRKQATSKDSKYSSKMKRLLSDFKEFSVKRWLGVICLLARLIRCLCLIKPAETSGFLRQTLHAKNSVLLSWSNQNLRWKGEALPHHKPS